MILGANVGVNMAVLRALEGAPSALHLAFLTATAISGALNFIGMKLFVLTLTDTSPSK